MNRTFPRIIRPFLLVLFVSAIFFIPVSLRGEISYKVIAVTDGDTVKILYGNQPLTLRLDGIDSPERDQAFGRRAKQFLSNLVFGKSVKVYSKGRDKYRRELAIIFLESGENVNQEMVRAGYAWWYKEYSSDFALKALEEEARKAKRGLWQDKTQVPPWDFRHNKRTHLPGTVLEGLAEDEQDFVEKPLQGNSNSPNISNIDANKIVYVSPEGFFHNPSCKSLNQESVPIIMGRARKRYRPCPACFPSFNEENLPGGQNE